MTPSESTPASRLCAACGMCCNGVMFHGMILQAADSARALSAKGLKVKRRHDGVWLHQPCPAHSGSQCTIYAQRPQRCRLFACKQLQELEAGMLAESEAMARIFEAQEIVEELRGLLRAAGDDREHKPLATRCDSILHSSYDPKPGTASLHSQVRSTMLELEKLLADHFRTEPVPVTSHADH